MGNTLRYHHVTRQHRAGQEGRTRTRTLSLFCVATPNIANSAICPRQGHSVAEMGGTCRSAKRRRRLCHSAHLRVLYVCKKNKNQVISVKWWKIYVDNKFSFGTPKVRVQVAVQFIKW